MSAPERHREVRTQAGGNRREGATDGRREENRGVELTGKEMQFRATLTPFLPEHFQKKKKKEKKRKVGGGPVILPFFVSPPHLRRSKNVPTLPPAMASLATTATTTLKLSRKIPLLLQLFASKGGSGEKEEGGGRELFGKPIPTRRKEEGEMSGEREREPPNLVCIMQSVGRSGGCRAV